MPIATDAGTGTGRASGKARPKRRVVNGAPSNNLTLSAHIGSNETLFPKILKMYAAEGSRIADITYGKGVFWRNVPEGRYELLATDLVDGVDCRRLPYDNGEIDCVVFDPPYMHSPGGTTYADQTPFEVYYRNNGSGNRTPGRARPCSK